MNPRATPTAVHRNTNGSIDVGELQINSIHFPELAAYGVSPSSLQDQCVNIYVAAWQLKQKMVKYGNTWAAIGSYHSKTPRYRDQYATAIQRILMAWGLMPPANAPARRGQTGRPLTADQSTERGHLLCIPAEASAPAPSSTPSSC
ncbi:Hpa2 protein [Candidatus Paraburkholderia schumanniana]|nr:Hpa2 protein [Candidatus Paraburkholderia schumannianae]